MPGYSAGEFGDLTVVKGFGGLDEVPGRVPIPGEGVKVSDIGYVEMRSLAAEFRLESLLRRSDYAHMLVSPKIELQWSMTSNSAPRPD